VGGAAIAGFGLNVDWRGIKRPADLAGATSLDVATAGAGGTAAIDRWRVFAGLLVAFDPILLHQATLIMNETPSALLAVLAWLAFLALAASMRNRPEESPSKELTIRGVNLGGALMLAVYCRPTFLIWAALAPFALLAVDTSWGRRWLPVARRRPSPVLMDVIWALISDASLFCTTYRVCTLYREESR
jgi:hypothetical protein